MHTGIWWGILKERSRLEELDINGMVILKDVKEMDYIQLAEDRGK